MARLKSFIIAAPKGSLGESTQKLFSKIGLHYDLKSGESVFEFKCQGVKFVIKIMRSQSIPRNVLLSEAHMGITGRDCIEEDKLDRQYHDSDVQGDVAILRELNYNKTTTGCIKVVSVRRKLKDGKSFEIKNEDESQNIISEYPNLTRKYYPKANIQPIPGGAEDEIQHNEFFHLACCVTETGKSLRKKGLEIEKILLKTTTVLIANEYREDYNIFSEMLEGSLLAPEYKTVKIHVMPKMLNQVLEIIPALQEPNVVWLKHKKMYSVETVTKITELFFLRDKLKPLGVTGIVVQPVDIIIP